MVTIATQQKKQSNSYSDCPLRYYWNRNNAQIIDVRSLNPAKICDPRHNHVFAFSDWNDTEQAPIPPSTIAFKSLAKCNIQARAIKRFYKSHPFDKSIYSHAHYTGATGTSNLHPDLYCRNNIVHEHPPVIGGISRFYF